MSKKMSKNDGVKIGRRAPSVTGITRWHGGCMDDWRHDKLSRLCSSSADVSWTSDSSTAAKLLSQLISDFSAFLHYLFFNEIDSLCV